jgi:hypothetical protein
MGGSVGTSVSVGVGDGCGVLVGTVTVALKSVTGAYEQALIKKTNIILIERIFSWVIYLTPG